MDLNECDRKIEQLREERKEYVRQAAEKRMQGTDILELQLYDLYVESVQRNIDNELQRRIVLARIEEGRRQLVVEANQETESIIKLKQKKRTEYEKEVQKQEEQFIEEFVSNQRVADALVLEEGH